MLSAQSRTGHMSFLTGQDRTAKFAGQGRILSNISLVCWAMEFQEKMLLRFIDLYDCHT